MFKSYCLLFTLALGVQATDASSSWYGTWKMDAAKSNSKFAKSATLIIRKEGENDVLDFSTVDLKGKPSKERIVQPHGGGKVVVDPPEPEQFDDVTLAVPDDHQFVYTYKRNGRIVAENHVTLSADGKSSESRFTVLENKAFTSSAYMVKQ